MRILQCKCGRISEIIIYLCENKTLLDKNKNYKREQATAAMLNAYKDELDRLSTSSPGGDMSLLMQMLAFPTQDTITFDSPMMHEFQNMSEEAVVRAERKERKRELNRRKERINLSDKQRSAHFIRKQKEYDVEVGEKLLELDEWIDDIETFEARIPNQQDFDSKINEIHDGLKELYSRINPFLLFKNGADDTALCGRILIKMEKDWDSEEEKEAVCLMSALQWLIRQQAANCPVVPETTDCAEAGEETEETSPVPVVPQKEEDEETTALRKLLVEKLHIPTDGDNSDITFGDKTYSQGQILASTMSLYRDKNIEWAKTTSKFAGKVAPILNRSKGSIEKKINRPLKNIKDIPLKNLSEEEIMKRGNSKALSKQIYKEWEGLYPIVLQLSESVPEHKIGQ